MREMRGRSTSSIQRAQRGRLRAWVVVLAASVVLGGAAPARAAENPVIEGAGVVFDLIVLRPLGVGRVVFGFASFVVAALPAAELPPLRFGGGSGPGTTRRWRSATGEAWRIFVGEPFEATFMTPLGEFEEE